MDDGKRLERNTETGARPQCLESSEVYSGRVLRVTTDRVRLPNGHEVKLEIIRHPGAAAVVPVDETGNVVLVRQVRYATGGWLLEIPAGKLETGELPESCARRELIEETGFAAGKLVPLGFIWTSPGFTDERIWLFLATELAPARQSLDADEVLSVTRMPFSEAVAQARRGEICDGKSVCGLLRAAELLQV